MALADITASGVRFAMEEFDRIGRDAFLERYAITRKLAALSECALVCAIKCHSADLLKRALQRLATVLDASKDALARREHYLAIVDNVLPRLAVERITGRS